MDKAKEVKYVHFNDEFTARSSGSTRTSTSKYRQTPIFSMPLTPRPCTPQTIFLPGKAGRTRSLFRYGFGDPRPTPGDWSPTIGNFLGDMTDELEKPYGAGSYITEFVSGGPKNYAYKCIRPERKPSPSVIAKSEVSRWTTMSFDRSTLKR